jgi:hypothetical protein
MIKHEKYTKPLADQISLEGQRIVCVSDQNVIPGMSWGGQYNDEPTD